MVKKVKASCPEGFTFKEVRVLWRGHWVRRKIKVKTKNGDQPPTADASGSTVVT
jgi:hypothetical protein